MLTLFNLQGDLIIIDEIQRPPELFPVLRVLVDEQACRFLILGSASRDLLRQSSETLAGRIGYIELPPFSISETEEEKNCGYEEVFLVLICPTPMRKATHGGNRSRLF